MKPKLVPLQIATKTPKNPAPRKERDAFQSAGAEISPQNQGQGSIGANRKILVVDDNPVVLKAFEMRLKGHGFNVITATEGSAVVSMTGQENPDLIILDLNFVPSNSTGATQWSGLTILKWLGRFKEVADIPVMIVTGEEPAGHRDQLMAAGAVAFFQKPVDFEKLLTTILQVLGRAGHPPSS